MVEKLIVVLEHCNHLDYATRVDLALVREGDLDRSNETDADLHSLLGHYSAARLDGGKSPRLKPCLRLGIVGRAKLNDFVTKHCISNLVTGNFTELVHCSDLRVLNLKVDLNMAAIHLL